jgi:hypothetical protein
VHIPQAVNDTVTTNENTSVTGNVSTNDIPSGDGGNVWSVDTPPVNGALIFNNDGSFNYTPTENWYGTDSFTYIITDVNGDISTATVTINVNKVDNAPVLNLITNQTTNENQLLQFTITATDPDGDSLTYYATNLQGDATINATTGLVTWTPTITGTYPVTFYVTDGNLTTNQTININVNKIDQPPILNTITNQNTNENQLLQFTITATDPDGDSLTYLTAPLPYGSNLNSTTGVFTWIPTYTQSGVYPVTFYITDGNLTASQTINITVNKVDIFDNSIQIENKGKSKIYYNYEITITEPNKTIIKKSISGYLNAGESKKLSVGSYKAGTKLNLLEYIYNKATINENIDLLNEIIIANKVVYKQEVKKQNVKPSPNNILYPVKI